VERELLQENVGVQDQLHATFGGINRFDFERSDIRISPVQIGGPLLKALGEHMVLVHTGVGRRATTTVAEQIARTRSRAIDADLSHLYGMVGECVALLEGRGPEVLPELGRRLSESWLIKRNLSGSVSNDTIDELFAAIQAHGAFGAKLCGAGGGGFFMALVPPERQAALAEAVAPLAVIPVDIDLEGATLVYAAGASGTRSGDW